MYACLCNMYSYVLRGERETETETEKERERERERLRERERERGRESERICKFFCPQFQRISGKFQ